MNGKKTAVEQIVDFIETPDEQCLLLTGTHQYEKHFLIMSALEHYYKNAHILYRISALMNITDRHFTPLKRQPKAGEVVALGHNYYEFDSFNNGGTWSKTSQKFDFALFYPTDAICHSGKLESVETLFSEKHIPKIFLCSWTDMSSYDYSIFDAYVSRHVVYDAEEDDPAYHQRVLNSTR